jgi:hypothetical protein
MSNGNTVTVEIYGGPTITVPWTQGMNAQQALEGAYQQVSSPGQFTYALQYYGSSLGYLVVMINETYDSFISSAAPYYYWEFLVNGKPSSAGIDGTTLNSGDVVGFEFQIYIAEKHKNSTLRFKHEFQTAAAASN